MKISVITASFNQGPYIKRCVDSVRNQKGDFLVEHIILDNCSTDETASVLDEYKSNPGRVDLKIIIKPDKGQTAAINDGFSMATGDVVCWLNTDEWYESGALQAVVNYFHANPGVDVVFGDSDFVNASGQVIRKKREFFYSESMLIFYGCYIPSCATFVRRSAIDAGFFLDPGFKVAMDLDWYVRLSKNGFRFGCLSIPIASFTWHDTNISSIYDKKRREEVFLIKEKFSGVKGHKIFRLFFYDFMYVFWIFVRNSLRVFRFFRVFR